MTSLSLLPISGTQPTKTLQPLWLVKETWNQRRSATIHRLHQKLGPVVRISPNQVLLNDPKAIPEIYGHLQARKFEKDVFYDNVSPAHLSPLLAVAIGNKMAPNDS